MSHWPKLLSFRVSNTLSYPVTPAAKKAHLKYLQETVGEECAKAREYAFLLPHSSAFLFTDSGRGRETGEENSFDQTDGGSFYLAMLSDEEVFYGFQLLKFVEAFFTDLIQNRLDLLEETYVELPESIAGDLYGNEFLELETESKKKYFLRQVPFSSAYVQTPADLFWELRASKADVLPEKNHSRQENHQEEFGFQAFFLLIPALVIREGAKLEPIFDKRQVKKKEFLTKAAVFSRKSSLSNEEIEREGKQKKKLYPRPDSDGTLESPHRGPGRPKGSKNKKTLEKEALMEKQGISPAKSPGGRPKGSKNDAT